MMIDGGSFGLGFALALFMFGFALALFMFGVAVGVFVVTMRWMSRRAIILLDEAEEETPEQSRVVPRNSLYHRN